MEEYIATVSPLLDEMVTVLIRDRPNEPIKFLVDFLTAKSATRLSPKLLPQLEEVGDDDDYEPTTGGKESEFPNIVSSPTSQGLLSPTHSPSNVARYLNQGQRISIPAESTGALMRRFEENELSRPLFPKSNDERKIIFNLFRNTVLFADKLEIDLIPVFDAMKEELSTEPDSAVPIDKAVVFIGRGGVETERMCKGELELEIKGPGDVIGELTQVCQDYKVVTTEPNTSIWRIERDYFDYLIRVCSQRRRERLMALLASVPILSSMSMEDHQKISDALRHEHFKTGDEIVRQGEPGNTFYIVESGECIVSKILSFDDMPHQVEKYSVGDYFGELSLIRNEPRAATVVAASEDVSVLSLDQESFKRLLGPIEDLLVRDYGEI